MFYQKNGMTNKIKTSACDMLNYLLRTGTDQQVNFVFHLNGNINDKMMKKAVRLSMDAEPVLGCKLIIKKKRAYWERREDIEKLDYFKLIKTRKPEKELKKFVLSQIDPTTESILKIRVYRAETDTLVIKSDHTVMDGGGFYDYLTLLCTIYNKLLENPNFSVEPNTVSQRGLKQVMKHYNLIKKVRSLVSDKGYNPTWSFPNIGTGRTEKNYVLRKISKERFERIKAYGKNYSSTINDVFITAAFRALFVMHKPPKHKAMKLAIPTDLRVLMPGKKANSVTNLVSATFVDLKNKPDESFDEMLIKVNKQMIRKKEILLGLGQMFAINNIFRLRYSIVEKLTKWYYGRLYKKGKSHPIITNVGRIDNPKRFFGEVAVEDAYLVTPVNWSPNFSMGISSYDKQITLSIGFCEDSYEKQTVEYFLDLLLKELPS
jgi:NRPS condensation-like uncharacterized protein